MNHIQEKYLDLLKAAIWSTDVNTDIQPEMVSDIIRLAAFQGTGPLVYDQLLKLQNLEIPTELRMQMKQQCVSNMMLQQTMRSILIKAWTALKDADIHPVLLKGFSIAQYYPQPHLRQWGDIDLYVGKKQYHATVAVLKDRFPETSHPKIDDEERKHFNFDFPNTAIETHRISMEFAHPRDRRYYEALEEKYLTKDGPSFNVEGLSITTPDDAFNLFFVFLHAWHHFIGTGMSMKQLCDIAILLHTKRKSINIEQLHEMLCKLHLLEVWQLIMYIMVHYVGVPRTECLFYVEKCSKRAESLFERILSEGSSYKKDEINAEGTSYIKRKLLTFRSRLADSKRVRPFAPRYARHMVISDFVHGIERTLKGK